MRNPLTLVTAAAAGALAMYWLDGQSGRRRRKLVGDKLAGAGHDLARQAQVKARRARDHLQGVATTGSLDRVSRSEPLSDQQLHDRIRSRLGRLVSHPKSIDVDIEGGHVCLRGHILTKEQQPLLRGVQAMAGVQSVRDELVCHDSPQGIPELQGRTEPRGREQAAAAAALHESH